MCREFFAGYPDGVTAQTTAIATPTHAIPIRIYRTAAPDASALVLYFHGGGFILGGLDSHDDVCAELCARTGYEVVSVDYRLAPEHLHPAAFDDALAAFEWAATTYARPILLAGDSAGGNLAAAVSHATRGHSRAPIGQVLIYPGLGGDTTQGSYVDACRSADADGARHRLLPGHPHRRRRTHRRHHAVAARRHRFLRLPPTVIVTAECDPLSSDGEAYRDRILAAGGKAWWFEEPGLVHGYLQGTPHDRPRARQLYADRRSGRARSARGSGRIEQPPAPGESHSPRSARQKPYFALSRPDSGQRDRER